MRCEIGKYRTSRRGYWSYCKLSGTGQDSYRRSDEDVGQEAVDICTYCAGQDVGRFRVIDV
jgi:hypothetical protein